MGSCLTSCCGSAKETPTTTFQPSANRHCTDILFLLLYIASFGGMLACILSATGKGSEPERIYHGINLLGETCGQGLMHDQPYNAWITMPSARAIKDPSFTNSHSCTDCFNIKTCLSSCDLTNVANTTQMIDTYPSIKFGYFCIPDLSALTNLNGGVSVSFSFSGDFDTAAQNASRAMGDLYTVWPLILGSVAVALLFSFLYNFLSETFAGLLVGFTLLIITAGGVLASYTLIKAGRNAREAGTATNSSNAMYGLGIVIAILTLVFLCVIIALRQRIRIAIEIVKEAARCIHDIWALIVYPIIPMIIGMGYIAFWIVVTVYIFAVWQMTAAPLPNYITDSPTYVAADFPLNVTSGVHYYETSDWDTSMQKAFVYVFFHLLWSAQFIIYFAYIVMAGTVAQWYFAPKDANERRIVGKNPGELSNTPITDSCGRTCRFHIGTVAVAALIIAIIQFIRACVKYLEKKCLVANGGKPNYLQRAIFCLINCCLRCVECCMDKINKNALVWTAIWGDSFGTAACSSFMLLWSNLLRVGALSLISTFLLFIGKVLIALATLGFAAIFIHFQYPDISSPVLPLVVIFIIGYIVGSLFMAVFEVAMDTIFLCFLIDEKMHAASGTMCASKGLRSLVESEDIRKESAALVAEDAATKKARDTWNGTPEGQPQQAAGPAVALTGVTVAN